MTVFRLVLKKLANSTLCSLFLIKAKMLIRVGDDRVYEIYLNNIFVLQIIIIITSLCILPKQKGKKNIFKRIAKRIGHTSKQIILMFKKGLKYHGEQSLGILIMIYNFHLWLVELEYVRSCHVIIFCQKIWI